MKYYKVINEQLFVGIATTSELRKIQLRHNILISCTEQEAECIQIEDNYYHAGWMKAVREDIGAITADVIEIDKEEYDELYELIEHDEEIEPYPEPEPSPEPEPEPEDITVAYAKKLKLKDMSNTCNNIIFAGIDVVLSDEETHHFSLTEYDQLNLFKLETLARSGQEVLPYHEDGELCKFYPAVDIITIANAATQYITYHTTYFNSLKAYINSLRSLNTISKVTYGMDIPKKYQSDVWKEINKNDET